MSVKIEIDPNQVKSEFDRLKSQIEAELNKGVRLLAQSTEARIKQMADEKMKIMNEDYKKAVHFEQIDNNIFVVTLDQKMLFREEGKKSWNMIDTHLQRNYKVGKDGSKFKVIPFEHGSSEMDGGETKDTSGPKTQKQQDIIGVLRKELEKKNIPFKEIEKDASGQPKLGKLHTLNLPSEKPSKNARFPALQGLTIFQEKDKAGVVQRRLMTFRVMSEKQKGDGRWIHPGFKPLNLFEEAAQWAEQQWEQIIAPMILKGLD